MPTVTIDPDGGVEYTIHLASDSAPVGEPANSQTDYPDNDEIAGYSNYWTTTIEINGRVKRVNAKCADVTIKCIPDQSADG